MIEQASRSGSRGVHRTGHRAPVDRLFVERAIQSPPYEFENLFEVRWSARWRRHSSRESRIQMSVSANHARHYKLASEIDYLFVLARFKRGASLNYVGGRDSQIAAFDTRGIQIDKERRFEEVGHIQWRGDQIGLVGGSGMLAGHGRKTTPSYKSLTAISRFTDSSANDCSGP